MDLRRITTYVALAACMASVDANGFAQTQQLPIVDRFALGDEVTIQGCVKVIPDRESVFLTQIMSWPILRRTSVERFGPYHFWTTEHVRELSSYIGDTVQMKGRIIKFDRSEIETEPGLHRFGDAIGVELPMRDVVVDAEAADFDLTRVPQGDDIALTLAQVDVDSVMRIMRGCVVTAPRARR